MEFIYMFIMPRDLKSVFEGIDEIKNKAAEVILKKRGEENMVDVETGKITIPNIKHFYNGT